MKKFFLSILILIFSNEIIIGQIRIVEVDPTGDRITIKNFGGSTVDISLYRLCALIVYNPSPLSTYLESGSLNLAAGTTVVLSGWPLTDAASDLGIYLASGAFSDPAAMVDFTQWGSSPNGRESVAVAKGIWTAGEFISGNDPYFYTGDGSQNGLAFWRTASAETDITSFTLTEQTGPATIDAVNHTVDIEVAFGTIATSLTPTITVSAGATVSPLSGVAQNYTSPVNYTVTAEDGVTTQPWAVTVAIAPNTETDILTFTLAEQTSPATINAINHTVDMEVAFGTIVASLAPTITLSLGATVSPLSGVAQDFTSPVNYIVTAEDGSTTQPWAVTISIAPNTETDIITFTLPEQTGPATVDAVNHTVDIEVAFGTIVTSLSPTITLSTGATVSPLSGVVQNFTSPVNYTVTAEDGVATQPWAVTVTVAPSNGTNIFTFTLPEQTDPATIDAINHTVDIEVAFGTIVTSLTPTITLSTGATVSPLSGVAQDFTSPVNYTVTAEDGVTTQIWVATVTVLPPPTITNFTPASGPIGTSVNITGTNFDAAPTNNIVFFGATQANVTAATTTELTVIVPIGSTYQPITVLTNELLAYSDAPFVVTFTSDGTGIDVSSFDANVDFTTGTDPNSVSIGDLDGDGKADLAVTNFTSSTVSVFRNTGTSTGTINYATKVDLTAGLGPSAVSIGDLDGDGKADLAVANIDNNTVSVFRNTSTSPGTINYATKVDLITGTSPFSISIGDLDGDGKADLAVANQGNTVSVFRNTSTSAGIISYAAKMDIATGSSPRSIAMGDLDGDGKADLVVGIDASNTISVFRNTSSGTGIISYAAKIDFIAVTNPASISLGDLDGDGKADLAVANNVNNTVSVLRNTSTGAGTISFDTKVDFITGSGPLSISISDLDGDGKADLAVANEGSATVSVLRNTSTGAGSISFATKVDIATGSFPQSVSIGDLDGDGKADLAVAGGGGSNTVSVFRNALITPTDILTFTLPEQTGPATIDAINHTVDIEVVFGTIVTSLTPTITLSTGATVSPLSGVAQDFTSPVNYTVTAEDGVSTQIWVVTVTIEAPPTLISPIDQSTDVNVKPLLSWSNVVSALSYDLQVSSDQSFSSLVIDETGINTTIRQVVTLIQGATYFARVRAVNSSGPGNYSQVITFTTLAAPDVSTVSILSSFTSPGSSIKGLTWDGNSLWMIDNLGMVYEMDTLGNVVSSFDPNLNNTSFSDLSWDGLGIWIGGGSEGTVWGLGELLIDTQGNRLDSIDAFEWPGSGIEWDGTHFWISNVNSRTLHKYNRSGSEILNFPVDAADQPSGVSFDGTNLWLGTQNNGLSKWSRIGQSVFTFDLSTLGITVSAFNAVAWDGKSLWYAPESQFTIYRLQVPYYHSPPDIPTLLSPADTEANVSLTPTLSWSNAPGATSYHLQVAVENTFTTIIFEDSILTSTSLQIGPITSQKVHYWRLKAKNSMGSSGFSAPWSFTTGGLSAETNILTFTLPLQSGPTIIDVVNHTVDIKVAFGTIVTALFPTITLSTGATVSPLSGVAQDFTSPVNYTVTAEDGNTTQDWVVTVRVAPPTITSFSPTSGPIGTSVTITGTNFDADPALTNNIVFFGATQANVTAASTTELTVIVPIGATYQPITVLTNELLAYSNAPFLVTFASDGSGIDTSSFAPKVDFTTGSNPKSVSIGDLDGDGKADLVVTNENSSTVSVFRNTTSGAGSISYAAKVDFTTGTLPISVSIGDLDGDGKADLAVANMSSSTVSVLRNNSTSPGIISYDIKVDYTAGLFPRSVSIGDLDGDGRADLAVANSNGVSVFRNTSTGAGTISYATKVDFATGSLPISVSIGDLDGDGRADLAVANLGSNTVSVFRNTSTSAGSISYAPKVDYTTGNEPESVSIGDLDGDGRADLAVANSTIIELPVVTVSVFRNTSTSAGIISYATKVDFTTGYGSRSVSIGDLDGDGKADLAVTSGNGVSVFRNTSTGAGTISYAAKVDFTTGLSLRSVSIGDLDGDGKADLAVANNGGNTVSVLRNAIIALPGNETNIAAFILSEQTGSAIIDTANHTVNTEVISGSDLTAITPTITLSPGATINPLSGTSQDFSNPFNYTVTAEDGVRTQLWTVFVSIEGVASNLTDIISFTLSDQIGLAIIDTINHTVTIEVALGTDVSSLTPTISLVPGATIFPVTGVGLNFTNPVTYTVTAEDDITTQDWIVTVIGATDQTNPVITILSLPTIFPAGSGGERVAILANDNVGVTEVTFNTRLANQTDFVAGPISSPSDTFTTTIIQSDVIDIGLEYFFLVKDAASNQVSTDTVLIVIQYGVDNSPGIPNLGVGGNPENWRMFSIPFVLQDKTVAGMFESQLGTYDNSKWRIVHYKNDIETFVEFRQGLSIVERSKGYWFNSVEQANIPMGAGKGPTASSKTLSTINLNQGWSQIGNPYSFNVSWTDILTFNGATGVEGLRVFTGGTALTDATTLKAYDGAYVFSDQAIALQVPLVDAGGRTGRQHEDVEGWQLLFNAKAGLFANTISGLGMHPEASDSKDGFDRIRVPRFVQFVDVTFPHPEYFAPNFAMDIVPETENFTWEFVIESNVETDFIHLDWDQVIDLNAEMFVLYDPGNEVIIDLKSRSNYSYRKEPSKSFKVIYGSRDYLAQELNEGQVLLGSNYPNPFNQTTVIPFSLFGPDNQYQVELSIYDLRGNLVGVILDKSLTSGIYQVEWEAVRSGLPLPSGLYIYTLRVNSENLQKTINKKMLID